MPLMDMVSPALTTIRIEHHEMGRKAAEFLLQGINTGVGAPRQMVLMPKLVVRNSTAPVGVPSSSREI